MRKPWSRSGAPAPRVAGADGAAVGVTADAPAEETAPPVNHARAALASRDFRLMWAGTLVSNVGTWMQNVVLGAYAYEVSRSATFVSVVYFAQLGPLLLLSVVGGALADTVDRRRLLLFAQGEQLVASILLAGLVFTDDPPRAAIVGAVLAVGIGNAVGAPSWIATVPTLVPRQHLSGAVSLNMTAIQGSRVVGPALASLLFPLLGAGGVFLLNAGTYLFIIAALLVVRFPRPSGQEATGDDGILARLAAGLRAARSDPLVRRILVTLFVFSLLCLPFVGQMPTLAAENLGLRPRSTAYGLLYACFGVGAVIGTLSVSTFLARRSRELVVRVGLGSFAVVLAAFALLRSPWPAYPVVALLGFCYFATVTALNTRLQEHLDEAVRGRVMALWLMAFGGTVPVGLLIAGPIAEMTSITAVLLYGAAVALALVWYARLDRLVRTGSSVAARPAAA